MRFIMTACLPLLLALQLQPPLLGVRSTEGPTGQKTEPFSVLAIINPGRDPHQISFSGDGKTAFIAATGSNQVTLVDVDSLKIIHEFSIDDGPIGVSLVDGERLLASRYRSERVSVYNLRGNALSHILVGRAPSMLAGPLPNGHFLVSVESMDRLCDLDLEAEDPLVTQFYPTGRHPLPPSVTSDGRLAFVPNYESGTVTTIDLIQRVEVGEVAVGGKPGQGAVLSGDLLYAVPLRDRNEVVLVHAMTGEVEPGWKDGIGESPFAIRGSPDNRWLFVANTGSSDVSAIDLDSGRVAARLVVGPIPVTLSVDPTGRTLWVASDESDTVSVVDIPASWVPPTTDLPIVLDSFTEMLAQQTAEQTVCSKIEREVLALHVFYENWYRAEIPADDRSLGRLTAVLADDFQHVSPEGTIADRFNLIRIIRSAHGRNDQLQIQTREFSCRAVDSQVFLATYVQRQQTTEKTVERYSSAVFRLQENTPNGVEWVHLQETLRSREEQ